MKWSLWTGRQTDDSKGNVYSNNRWKDPENEFRKSVFKLTEIPTVIEYGTVSIDTLKQY